MAAWLLRSVKWWSVVTMLVAMLLSAVLITTLMNPPELIWDGFDDQGRAIGGYVVGEPAVGALVWVMGIAALFAASVYGLVEQTRQKRIE